VRRLLLLSSSVVFFDTLFFAALTPLLPHYVQTLHMGKTGAGVLAATYPLGALVGAIPSGIVAARAGVKPTVLVGLVAVAACTVLFGLGATAWQLDLVRFVQGLASAFSWTGALAWLVAGAPAGRRGALSERPSAQRRRVPCSDRCWAAPRRSRASAGRSGWSACSRSGSPRSQR
jgi:MFS family permease